MYISRYLNKFHFVEKMTPQQCQDSFGCDHPTFYRIRAQFVDTLYGQPGRRGPYVCTKDGILSAFLLKIRTNLSMRNIGIIMGLSESHISKVFKDLLVHIQSTDPVLQRNRNLANPQQLNALMEEVHQVFVAGHSILPRLCISWPSL